MWLEPPDSEPGPGSDKGIKELPLGQTEGDENTLWRGQLAIATHTWPFSHLCTIICVQSPVYSSLYHPPPPHQVFHLPSSLPTQWVGTESTYPRVEDS